MQYLSFPDVNSSAQALAHAVAERLHTAIQHQGQAVLAVSGGKSPVPFFHALRQVPLAWQHVTVTLVDERFVPISHADSNAALVQQHLLQAQAKLATFRPLVTEAQDVRAELALANQRFTPPTVSVLGMGEDGHTASLFPGSAELADGLNPQRIDPVLTVQPLNAAHLRFTLSYAALLKSQCLMLSIQGENKHQVLEQARQTVSAKWPISYFLAQRERPLDVYYSA